MSDSGGQYSVEAIANMADNLVRQQFLELVRDAERRGLFSRQLSHQQVGELYSLCLPLAIFEALRSADFCAFRERWTLLAGAASEPWVVSLYLAAVASPVFVDEARAELARTALVEL